jgi:DNA-binding transcriptional LysR family regulator
MFDAFRHFVAIVEGGTFTAAARKAHLSQPALTASIHKLEEDMGARLFHRGPGGAALTAAGEALLPKARAALAAVEDGRRAVAEIMGLIAGEVRIGAGATACTYLLPPVLASYREEHRGVRFLLREATTSEVMAALNAGDLDLGVVTTTEGEPWIEDELILVAAPEATFEKGMPFVTFGRGSTTRELLERHFPGADVVMELGSIAAVKGNVRAGIGVALVSRAAVAHDIAGRRLAEVPHAATPIKRPLSIVHRGKERLPPAAAKLRELLLARREDVERVVRSGVSGLSGRTKTSRAQDPARPRSDKA